FSDGSLGWTKGFSGILRNPKWSTDSVSTPWIPNSLVPSLPAPSLRPKRAPEPSSAVNQAEMISIAPVGTFLDVKLESGPRSIVYDNAYFGLFPVDAAPQPGTRFGISRYPRFEMSNPPGA